MSVSSDIRFTRRKLSRPCRGCCAALASLLVLLLLAAVAVYLGRMYICHHLNNRDRYKINYYGNSKDKQAKEAIAGGGWSYLS